MRRLLCLMLLMFGVSAGLFAAPVIFYSDITSGPKTGGQNNQGAFVTLSGARFGATRGSGAVSIGGGQAGGYVSWTDSRIVFQLGPNAASGSITVTNADGTSNGVPFTVRDGRIFFVSASAAGTGTGTYADPWKSPKSFMDTQQAGDICYVMGGTYTGVYGNKYNSRTKMNVDYYNAPSGTASNPIVWCGYPGQTAIFQANGSAPEAGTFSLRSSYVRVVNLTLKGYGNGYYVANIGGDGNAFINCVIGFQKTLCYGMIGVESGGNIQIYGNEITGATSQNKLDHCIYFDGSPSSVDVGWNYFHNNQIEVGPVLSYNGSVGTISIHDNLIDTRYSNTNLDVVGQWAGVSTTKTSFYNNIVIPTVSPNRAATIYVNTGSLEAYNNTFINGVGGKAIFDGSGSTGVTAVNNIFYNQPTVAPFATNVSHSYNQFYNVNGSVSETGGQTGDPQFVNAAGGNYRLSGTGSPCYRTGTGTLMSARDRELTPRNNPPCRGAYEYSTGGSSSGSGGSVIPVTYYRISGSVKDGSGTGVSGVTLTLSGGASQTTQSAADGSYQFSNLPAQGSYTVTPAKSGVTFAPGTFTASNLSADATNGNFTATVPVTYYSVKGVVKNAAGTPLAGVSVALSGGSNATTTTASDGSYQFLNVAGGKSYTVTPGLAGYTFAPGNATISALSANATANFTASASSTVSYYSIKGSVKKADGTPVSGVNLSLSGGADAVAVTASDGSYQFLNLVSGKSYTIAADRAGYLFAPAALTVSALSGNVTGNNFTGTLVTYSLGGRVTDSHGNALAGATVELTGGTSRAATTAADGTYRFADLPAGTAYRLDASMPNWRFAPATLDIASLQGDLAGKDFTGKRLYSIRGQVKDAAGKALKSVQLVLTGGQSATATTDDNGWYVFNGLPEELAYSIRSRSDGYAFNPPTINTPSLSAAIDAWNFEGTRIAGVVSRGIMRVVGRAEGRGTINPDRGDTANIFFSGSESGSFSCRIFSLAGDLVWQETQDNVQQGAFVWAPGSVASGIYVACVQGPGLNTRQKIAILR